MSEEQVRRKGSYNREKQREPASSPLVQPKVDAPVRLTRKPTSRTVASRNFQTIADVNWRELLGFGGKLDCRASAGLPFPMRRALEQAAKELQVPMSEVIRRLLLILMRGGVK